MACCDDKQIALFNPSTTWNLSVCFSRNCFNDSMIRLPPFCPRLRTSMALINRRRNKNKSNWFFSPVGSFSREFHSASRPVLSNLLLLFFFQLLTINWFLQLQWSRPGGHLWSETRWFKMPARRWRRQIRQSGRNHPKVLSGISVKTVRKSDLYLNRAIREADEKKTVKRNPK